ncbi:hypothetical protein [Burkholderia cepacia]|uniref:hypothetical protein n=1 Tax=Burkholderia cepacia TaxID=292 RepID=UPI00075C5268|nr:hypothetical protein [Burkholderia cepacia]KVF14232.1 hypothetical protein WJ06_30200 [Burkholderia cepacia]UIY57354.1 hypothetical protein LZ568_03710 [Burkholderia cepacia]
MNAIEMIDSSHMFVNVSTVALASGLAGVVAHRHRAAERHRHEAPRKRYAFAAFRHELDQRVMRAVRQPDDRALHGNGRSDKREPRSSIVSAPHTARIAPIASATQLNLAGLSTIMFPVSIRS